ncbi:MAG: hypothetical protein H6735_32410 [Alphaproteobacteria bacterium]|nr:hypothetical protein [Alphaproteobacteria bacterium]
MTLWMLAMACHREEPTPPGETVGVDLPDQGPALVVFEAGDTMGEVRFTGTDDGTTVDIDAMDGTVEDTTFSVQYADDGWPTSADLGDAGWTWVQQPDQTFDAQLSSPGLGDLTLEGLLPTEEAMVAMGLGSEALPSAKVSLPIEGAVQTYEACTQDFGARLVHLADQLDDPNNDWDAAYQEQVLDCLVDHPDWLDQVRAVCGVHAFVEQPILHGISSCEGDERCRRRLEAAWEASRSWMQLMVTSLAALTEEVATSVRERSTCPWAGGGEVSLVVTAVLDEDGTDHLEDHVVGKEATLPPPATFELELIDLGTPPAGATVALWVEGTKVAEDDLLSDHQVLVLPDGAVRPYFPTAVTAVAALDEVTDASDIVTLIAWPRTTDMALATGSARLTTHWSDGGEQTGEVTFFGTDPRMAGTWTADGTVFDASWGYDDGGTWLSGTSHLELSADRSSVTNYAFTWSSDAVGPAIWTKTLTGGAVPYGDYSAGTSLRYLASDLATGCATYAVAETLSDGTTRTATSSCVADSHVTIGLYPVE